MQLCISQLQFIPQNCDAFSYFNFISHPSDQLFLTVILLFWLQLQIIATLFRTIATLYLRSVTFASNCDFISHIFNFISYNCNYFSQLCFYLTVATLSKLISHSWNFITIATLYLRIVTICLIIMTLYFRTVTNFLLFVKLSKKSLCPITHYSTSLFSYWGFFFVLIACLFLFILHVCIVSYCIVHYCCCVLFRLFLLVCPLLCILYLFYL